MGTKATYGIIKKFARIDYSKNNIQRYLNMWQLFSADAFNKRPIFVVNILSPFNCRQTARNLIKSTLYFYGKFYSSQSSRGNVTPENKCVRVGLLRRCCLGNCTKLCRGLLLHCFCPCFEVRNCEFGTGTKVSPKIRSLAITQTLVLRVPYILVISPWNFRNVWRP